MAIPTNVEIFMLAAIVCFSLFIFFVNREISRLDRSINQIVGQHNAIRDHVTLLGTHVNTCVSSLTARLESATGKLDMHASAIERIEWESTDEEKSDDVDKDSDANADTDADRSGSDSSSGSDIEVTQGRDSSDGHVEDTQMRSLLAHIDSVRKSTFLHEPKMHNIIEEPGAMDASCTITLLEPDIEQVKSILKASHVDCRGNRDTLMKKLAALQS